MSWVNQLLFGPVEFKANDEYLEFQFRFLCIVILAGALLTGLLVAASHAGANRIDPHHVRSMTFFTVGSVLIWFGLRGRKRWYKRTAWSYELLCMLEYISALYYVSEDEFRVVWFLTNIPGVYLLLGQQAGLVITTATAIGLVLCNSYLPSPYSPNAIATLFSSVIYLGIFFHVYAHRSISYFLRMRDSNLRLYDLAMHDQLTGILNSRAYYQACDKLIALAKRSGAQHAVLFVDLDHFKSVNDTHGHDAGDQVLKSAAACIAQNIRSTDSLGRIGGEEFSVFLPDTGMDAATQVAEKIRHAIEQLDISVLPDTKLKITASIGVARQQSGNQTLKDIQQQADIAMYQAKKAGRNRVSRFNAGQELTVTA